MKIVIDARIIYTSTGRYVERLVEYLQEIDHDNDYTLLLLKKDFERWQPKASNFHKYVADFQPYTMAEQFALWRLLRRLKPDLVHFTTPQQPLLYWGRSVTTVHDLTLIDFVNRRQEGILVDFYKQQLKPLVFRLLLHIVIGRSAKLITPTQYVREDIMKRFHVKPDRITFTHESAERLAAKAKPISALTDARFLLYVGNAFPYKNLRRLIDAASSLKDTTLVLAGKPEYFYEQLHRYVAAKQHANIHFAGFVSDSELAWLYQHAQLFVVPSLSEGFGLPALEAMSYGLPVASSDATCLPEVYSDAAVYFNPESTAEMVRVIGETLQNKKLLKDLGHKGERRIKQFSWKRMAEQTLEVYKKALKQ